MRFLTILTGLSLVFAAACGDHGAATPKDAAVPVDATDSTPDASCFNNPQTYSEIINACTSAQKIYKDSHPPLVNADGTLPPLPP